MSIIMLFIWTIFYAQIADLANGVEFSRNDYRSSFHKSVFTLPATLVFLIEPEENENEQQQEQQKKYGSRKQLVLFSDAFNENLYA